MAGVIASWEALNSSRFRLSAAAGFLWGLSIMIKHVCLFLPLLLSPLLYRKRSHLLIFLLGAYLLPSLWMARNYRLSGYAELSSQPGFDLLTHPGSAIESFRTRTDWLTAQARLKERLDRNYPLGYRNEFEQSRVYRQAVLKIFRDNLFLFSLINVSGAAKLLGGQALRCFLR